MASEVGVSAVNCRWGTAQVGDVLPLGSVLPGLGEETLAVLSSVADLGGVDTHLYELYFLGVWVGRVRAMRHESGDKWEVVV